VLAAEGYPADPIKGDPIEILDLPERRGAYLLHAGTAMVAGQLVSAGGRVLNAVGSGADLAEARANAYAIAGRVRMRGSWYRHDIAASSPSPNPSE
jgi:phosphoribosylamine---glycine ligase